MIKRFSLLSLLILSSIAQAAITYVGGAQDSEGANTNSLTLTLPTHQANDFCIVHAMSHDTGTDPVLALTVATGWTAVDSSPYLGTAGTDRVNYVWQKKLTSDSETSPVITTDTANGHSGTLNCFRGVDTATQLDATTTVSDTSNTSLPSNPAIDTATANAAVLLLQSVVSGNGTGMQAVAPSGYTIGAHVDADTTPAVATQNAYAISAYLLDVGAAGTETPGAWQHTNTAANTEDNSLITIALKPAAAASIEFTVGPSVAAATNGYTISGTITCTGTCTVYAAAYPPAASAPADCDAVQAGSGALFTANEVWTSGVGDSFLLTEANNVPRTDVYICGSDGTTDTAVTAAADQNRSADANQAITVLASVSATSAFALATDSAGDTDHDGVANTITGMADTSDFAVGMLVDVSAGFPTTGPYIVLEVGADYLVIEEDADSTEANITVSSDVYYNPSVAAGDVIEGDDHATCAAGTDALTWETDGDFSYTATNCGTTLTTIDYCIEDVTDATDAAFTTPSCWSADDKLYLFNSAPEFDVEQPDDFLIWKVGDALSGVDMSNFCNDADAHALTFAATGSWANGVSMDSAGAVSGTPDTEDESGTQISILCQDPGLLSARKTFTQFPIDTWTMLDLTGGTMVEAETALVAAYPWMALQVEFSFGTDCSVTVAEDDIISQAIAASTEVEDPIVVFEVVVSSGETTPGCVPAEIKTRPKGVNSFGLSVGP